jgi:hypothetical protein
VLHGEKRQIRRMQWFQRCMWGSGEPYSVLLGSPQGNELDLLAAQLDLELFAGFEVLDLNQLLEAGADAIEALCFASPVSSSQPRA